METLVHSETPPNITERPLSIIDKYDGDKGLAALFDPTSDGSHLVDEDGKILSPYSPGEAAEILINNTMRLLGAEAVGQTLNSSVEEPAPMPHLSPTAQALKEQAAQPIYEPRRSVRGFRLNSFLDDDPFMARTTHAQSKRAQSRRSFFDVPFSGSDAFFAPPQSAQRPASPAPEVPFSSPQTPGVSPVPQPYSPNFDLKFLEPTFSTEALAKTEQALHDAATRLNVQPGDPEARVRVAREALKNAHPDSNPDNPGANLEIAKALAPILRQESSDPAAQAARSARIERQQAGTAKVESQSQATPPSPEAVPAPAAESAVVPQFQAAATPPAASEAAAATAPAAPAPSAPSSPSASAPAA